MSGQYEFVLSVDGVFKPGEPIDTVDKLAAAFGYVAQWRTFRDGSHERDMAENLSPLIDMVPGIQELRDLSAAPLSEQWIEEQCTELAKHLHVIDAAVGQFSIADFTTQLRDMRTGKPAGGEPLTDAQQTAFDYIKEHGPVLGKEVCKILDGTSEATFTKHFVPPLRKHGVKNKRGAGYYVDSTRAD